MAAAWRLSSDMKLAVVIPVHGDHAPLARLLHQIDEMTGVDEVVISASDAWKGKIPQLKKIHPCIVSGPQGRGAQLNRGRQSTSADLLWFLHADAVPPIDGPDTIRCAATSGVLGGFFRFRFEGIESRAASRLAQLINWRAARAIAYGDQGLWFDADAFDRAGGFDAVPLFEEVKLVRSVKSSGRFVPHNETIGVDPRRWQRTGWIKRTLVNRALAIGHACGVSPHTLARWYARL
ncbi:MAG: glycosyl transferase family 2 [Pseudomonadota bacterium]